MEESKIKNVYSVLTEIQNELKAPKNQYNAFGKYKYRSCEDIQEALKPLLRKFNCTLFLTDTIVNIESRFYVGAKAVLVYNPTGEKIEVLSYAREEENKKGMDGSQVTGASSSYSRKYALNGLFLIDDNKDSDQTNDGTEAPEKKQKTEPNLIILTNEQIQVLIDQNKEALALKKHKIRYDFNEDQIKLLTDSMKLKIKNSNPDSDEQKN